MDKIYLILLIPFLGTVLGSATVFFMKNKMNSKLEKFLSGFASGVMIAASIWSLLIPSTDMAKEQGLIEWVPASIGFLCGIAFLLVLDSIIPHLHVKSNKPVGINTNNFLNRCNRTDIAILIIFCSRCNDICSCRRTNTRCSIWRTFKSWSNWCKHRICNYDDIRYSTWIIG